MLTRHRFDSLPAQPIARARAVVRAGCAGIAAFAIGLVAASPVAAQSIPAGVFDVNGDGVADRIIKVPGYHGTVPRSGSVTIVSGATSQVLYTVTNPPPPPAPASPPVENDFFGKEVVYFPGPTGDLNNDGKSDFWVSAPRHNLANANGSVGGSVGIVRAYSGADGSVLYSMTYQAGKRYGLSLAAVPDQDRDGVADLLIQVGTQDTAGVWWERLRLMSGSTARAGTQLSYRKGTLKVHAAYAIGSATAAPGWLYLPTDLDDDGSVDADDLNLVIANLGQIPSSTKKGDVDKDGDIDTVDRDAVAADHAAALKTVVSTALVVNNRDAFVPWWNESYPEMLLTPSVPPVVPPVGSVCVTDHVVPPCSFVCQQTAGACPFEYHDTADPVVPGQPIDFTVTGNCAGQTCTYFWGVNGSRARGPGPQFTPVAGPEFGWTPPGPGQYTITVRIRCVDGSGNETWYCHDWTIFVPYPENGGGECPGEVWITDCRNIPSHAAATFHAIGAPEGGVYSWEFVLANGVVLGPTEPSANPVVTFGPDDYVGGFVGHLPTGPGILRVYYGYGQCIAVDECFVGVYGDADGDGLADYVPPPQGEIDFFHDSYPDPCPGNPDCDGDGFNDGCEVALGTDPEEALSTPDIGLDSDFDGLGDAEEVCDPALRTNPYLFDTDYDGVPDGAEIALGLNPRRPWTDGHVGLDVESADWLAGDLDEDGLWDEDEEARGWDSANPDMDGDGVLDGVEVRIGRNPVDRGPVLIRRELQGPDSDGDGLTDQQEIMTGSNPNSADSDWDGLPDGFEYFAGTNPNSMDTDADGIRDGAEDSDGDGLSNADEYSHGTAAHETDTDGDGVDDFVEVVQHSDPLDGADSVAPSAELLHDVTVHIDADLRAESPYPVAFRIGQRTIRVPLNSTTHWWTNSLSVSMMLRSGYKYEVNLDPALCGVRTGQCGQSECGSTWYQATIQYNNTGPATCLLAHHACPVSVEIATGMVSFSGYGAAAPPLDALYPIGIDLDIDSDNTNWFDGPAVDAAAEEAEEAVEDALPGKVIFANNGDFDADEIPDYADGLAGSTMGVPSSTSMSRFVPMRLRLWIAPEARSHEDLLLRFYYNANDPSEVEYVLDATGDPDVAPHTYRTGTGHLRIWKIDGTTQRHVFDDFVPSGSVVSPYSLNFATSDRCLETTLFVEATGAWTDFDRLDVSDASANRITVSVFDLEDRVVTRPTALMTRDAKWFRPTGATGNAMRLDITDYSSAPGVGDDEEWSPADATAWRLGDAYGWVDGAVTDGSSPVIVQLAPPLPPGLPALDIEVGPPGQLPYSPSQFSGGFASIGQSDPAALPPLPNCKDAAPSVFSTILPLPNQAFYVPPENLDTLAMTSGTDSEECMVHFRVRDAGTSTPLIASPFWLRRPPVIFLHGLFGHARGYWDHTLYFEDPRPTDQPGSGRDGFFTRLYWPSYQDTNTQGLDVQVPILSKFIQNVLWEYRSGETLDGEDLGWLTEESGGVDLVHVGHEHAPARGFHGRRYAANRVDIVGHSMGGQIARLYISNFSGTAPRRTPAWPDISLVRHPQDQWPWDGKWPYLRPENFGTGDIRRFIPIGSPFNGSPLGTAIRILCEPTPLKQLVVNREEFQLGYKRMTGEDLSTLSAGSGPMVATGPVDLEPNSNMYLLLEGQSPGLIGGSGTSAAYPTDLQAVRWFPIAGCVCTANGNCFFATAPVNVWHEPTTRTRDVSGLWNELLREARDVAAVAATNGDLLPNRSDAVVSVRSQLNLQSWDETAPFAPRTAGIRRYEMFYDVQHTSRSTPTLVPGEPDDERIADLVRLRLMDLEDEFNEAGLDE